MTSLFKTHEDLAGTQQRPHGMNGEPEAEGKEGLWAGEAGLRPGKGDRGGMALRLEFALCSAHGLWGDTSQTPLLGWRGRSPGTPTARARAVVLLLGPTQTADKSLCPGPASLPQAAGRRQPAQPEAGRSPGQLVLVTLYPTQGTLRTRNREQRSWRRYKAFLVTCAQPQPAPRLLWAPGPALRAPGPQPLLPGRPASALMPSQCLPHPPHLVRTEGSAQHLHLRVARLCAGGTRFAV